MVAIFDHPKNSGYPQPWHVDPQLGVGPSRALLGDWSIAMGKTEIIGHVFLIHSGPLNDVALRKS